MRVNMIYWIILLIIMSIPFIHPIGIQEFSSTDSYLTLQNKPELFFTSNWETIPVKNYVCNNKVNVIVLTFDDSVRGDKEYFINNYKKTLEVDKNVFIIALFPNEVVINIDKTVQPYFSDLLLEGFERKILKAKQNNELDKVLMEVAEKVQEKIEKKGWVSFQSYKARSYLEDLLIRLKIIKGSTYGWLRFLLDISDKAKKIESALI